MPDDPFESAEWRDYADRVRRELVPMIGDSAYVMSLVPDGETDVKFALELGLSIMMDKRIIAVVRAGVHVPNKLAGVADAIIEDTGDPKLLSRRLLEAMQEIDHDGPNT